MADDDKVETYKDMFVSLVVDPDRHPYVVLVLDPTRKQKAAGVAAARTELFEEQLDTLLAALTELRADLRRPRNELEALVKAAHQKRTARH